MREYIYHLFEVKFIMRVMDIFPFFEPQADDQPKNEYAARKRPEIVIEGS